MNTISKTLPTDQTQASRIAIIGSEYHHAITDVQGAALPAQLGPFNTGGISFTGGTPVGSPNCSLTLFQNGNWTFSGHFHDSGATSYNGSMTWIVTTNSGKAFSFSQSGHMAGTFEPGSRNWNFNASGNNPALGAAYAELCSSYHWRWEASVNLDILALVNTVVQGLEQAVGVTLNVISVLA